jgi:hypothetical protein
MAMLQLLFDFARDAGAGSLVRRRPSASRPRGRVASDPTVSILFPEARGSADGARPQADAARIAPPAVRRMPRRPRGVAETPMQRRYDAVVSDMLERHGLVVRKWRSSLSGIAIHRIYRDGREERLLESPYPTSPLRMSIFLHEVGHHAIGLGIHRPRCLEEHLAWEWSVARMREFGFATEGTVARRVQRSMEYAVAKSLKRGIRRLPVAVLPYAPEWVRAAVEARAA